MLLFCLRIPQQPINAVWSRVRCSAPQWWVRTGEVVEESSSMNINIVVSVGPTIVRFARQSVVNHTQAAHTVGNRKMETVQRCSVLIAW